MSEEDTYKKYVVESYKRAQEAKDQGDTASYEKYMNNAKLGDEKVKALQAEYNNTFDAPSPVEKVGAAMGRGVMKGVTNVAGWGADIPVGTYNLAGMVGDALATAYDMASKDKFSGLLDPNKTGIEPPESHFKPYQTDKLLGVLPTGENVRQMLSEAPFEIPKETWENPYPEDDYARYMGAAVEFLPEVFGAKGAGMLSGLKTAGKARTAAVGTGMGLGREGGRDVGEAIAPNHPKVADTLELLGITIPSLFSAVKHKDPARGTVEHAGVDVNAVTHNPPSTTGLNLSLGEGARINGQGVPNLWEMQRQLGADPQLSEFGTALATQERANADTLRQLGIQNFGTPETLAANQAQRKAVTDAIESDAQVQANRASATADRNRANYENTNSEIAGANNDLNRAGDDLWFTQQAGVRDSRDLAVAKALSGDVWESPRLPINANVAGSGAAPKIPYKNSPLIERIRELEAKMPETEKTIAYGYRKIAEIEEQLDNLSVIKKIQGSRPMTTPLSADNLVGAIAKIEDSFPGRVDQVRKLLRTPMKNIQHEAAKNGGVVRAEAAMAIRKDLNNILNDIYSKNELGFSKAKGGLTVNQAKKVMDDAIESAIEQQTGKRGLWQSYLDTYKSHSEAIDMQTAGQQLMSKLNPTNPQATNKLNSIDEDAFLRDFDKQVDNAGGSLTNNLEQHPFLKNVREDMANRQALNNSEGVVPIEHPLNQNTQAVANALRSSSLLMPAKFGIPSRGVARMLGTKWTNYDINRLIEAFVTNPSSLAKGGYKDVGRSESLLRTLPKALLINNRENAQEN